jgi:hypothetical protein
MMVEKANKEGELEPRATVKGYLTVRDEAQKLAHEGFFKNFWAISFKYGENS